MLETIAFDDDLTIAFDDALPISGAVDRIRAALEAHQVIVVAGETGSGKTTQLPKICLLAGRTRIGHTQPRRLAARTVAERIAEELGVDLGDTVGYQVRFTKKASRRTAVKVMTDGILLAEISHDRDLRAYDTLIIDEAHERSLNIDFLLGYLKQLLPRRPELRVIITSATIDTARFADHFGGAPIIEVSGRTFPVDVLYHPLADPETGVERDMIDGVCEAVTWLHGRSEGDVLVFLSGEREIRDAADALRDRALRNVEILPLYARLSAAEQHRVFQPHAGMRVVLATNVAETSLTVPGIRYVVDTGLARISRYSARTKVQRLPIEPISRASANQRAGRCGRLGPGVCIRLYTEEDIESRPEFTEPEILRTNLASVILQMLDARLGRIEDFPFVEAPDRGQVTDGVRLLRELGALADKPAARGHTEAHRLTPTGRLLARLPVDPRLGRMLVEAERRGVLEAVIPIVAGLAIPDVRERPVEGQQQADLLHRRFWAPFDPGDPTPGAAERDASDIAALGRLWDYLRARRKELSGNAFRRMCRDEYLNYLRIREWQDLVAQVREVAGELDLHPRRGTADADAVHISVLSGLLSHVGLNDATSQPARGQTRGQPRRGRRPAAEYLGARGSRFAIQPGSAAAKAEPPLVMAVELVETSRLWARTVAPVRAEWIEDVGAHLVTRQYSEPHWSASSGQAVASEKVSLYGVPIVAGRTVAYQRIDPDAARAIFLQAALVEGQWRTRHHFFARNERVRRDAAELEERTRRRDLVVDDRAIYDFYDARVPASVTSAAHFDRWWRDARRVDDHLLDLALDDLVDDGVDADAFPDTWSVGPTDLPLSYAFDPGAAADGLTVDVDVSVLNQLDDAPLTWHVPGRRHELATELVRSLPKAVRTRFVPAPDWARRALSWLDERPEFATRPFPDALAAALTALGGSPVTPDAFAPDHVPAHLRVRYVITDGETELGGGDDFEALRKQFAPRLEARLNRSQAHTHPGARAWEFGTLPETVEVARRPNALIGYPALADQGDTVGVRIATTPEHAARSQARGLRRLVALVSPDPTRWVFAHLSNTDRLSLGRSPYADLSALLADARLKATGDLLALLGIDPVTVRDDERFRTVVDAVRPDAADRMKAVVDVASRILARYHAVERLLDAPGPAESVADARVQLADLVFPGFISATPEPHFSAIERYLHALDVRARAWQTNPARDATQLQVIAELDDAYAAATARYDAGELPDAAAAVGWLLEELRVSLFAQSLRTSQSVSPKRVRAAISALAG